MIVYYFSTTAGFKILDNCLEIQPQIIFVNITILQGAFFPIPPIKGGAVEKIWYLMGKEFAAMGHNVVHISRSFAGFKDNEKVNGVNYFRLSGYNTPSSLIKLKWLDLLYSVRALNYIPKNTDVIVTNTFWSPIILRGKQGRKVYVNVERIPRGQMRFYQHVGMLRGGSPAICEAIKKQIHFSAHNLVTYIPNPVPFEVRQLVAQREKIILFVGRLHPEKGVHILLEAYSKIKGTISEGWKLVIVGPFDPKAGGGGDSYFQILLSLSKELDVKFVGPIYNEEELIQYYSTASIFCYPAQAGSGDAAPVSPREAMAYGCVPVVSQLDCFNDLIINGTNGVRFDHTGPNQSLNLANAISSLILNNAALKRMSEEGRLINDSLSPHVIAKKFIRDFEKI